MGNYIRSYTGVHSAWKNDSIRLEPILDLHVQPSTQIYKNLRILLLLVLIGCAAIAPPPGGPVDKTPPSLILVDPPSGTTGITPNFTVTLTFSERLDESASRKGLRFEPTPVIPPRITLKKDKLTVSFPEELAPKQTYILTVTRDILDERNNRLDKTYQLAFSTGEEISNGVVDGTVYDASGKSSLVYLYKVQNEELDSLFLREPDYFTETDDSGHYSFSYLDPGRYNLLAFEGGSPPAIIAPSRMPYGVYWQAPLEINEIDTIMNQVNMRISREIPPLKVLSIEMKTSKRGTIRFTNSVKLSEQTDLGLTLLDSLENAVVEPEHIFQYHDGDSELHFRADDLMVGKTYLLNVTSIHDVMRQTLYPFSRSIVIPQVDSLAPEIIFPEQGKSKKIAPGNSPLEIQFSGVVHFDDILQTVHVVDTSGFIVPVQINWPNPSRMEIKPENGWIAERDYEVKLFGHMIKSPEGHAIEDSIVTFEVKTGKEIGYGSLSGDVRGGFIEHSIVTASSAEKITISYSTDVNLESHFKLKKLPAGLWLLSAYQDRDINGRYTHGRAIPFQPAEPFLVLKDTLEVRANWELEGVVLRYPGKSEKID